MIYNSPRLLVVLALLQIVVSHQDGSKISNRDNSTLADSEAATQRRYARRRRRGRRRLRELMGGSVTSCLFYVEDAELTPILTLEEETNPPPMEEENTCTCELPNNGKIFQLYFSQNDHAASSARSTNICLKLVDNGMLTSGISRINLYGAYLDHVEESIILPPGPPNVVQDDGDDRRGRSLSGNGGTAVGSITVLAVRVVAPDASKNLEETSLDEDDFLLADEIFGIDQDPMNLKSQFEACSRGRVKILPAPDRVGGKNGQFQISNGVVTVKLKNDVSQGRVIMTNEVVDKLQDMFDLNKNQSPNGVLADHVMFCMPPDTKGSAGSDKKMAIALATTGGWQSWYSGFWCTKPSAQMHELGHNLYMGHSNDKTFESNTARYTYGGQTGVMGYVQRWDDDPKTCFNAGHMYELGWYKANDFLEIAEPPPLGGTTINLVGFASDTTKDYAGIRLVKISHPNASPGGWTNNQNLFLQYNLDVNYNSGTREGRNTVTIVEKPELTSAATNLVAMLDHNSVPFERDNFYGGGCGIKVSVLAREHSDTGGIAQVKITGLGCYKTKAPTSEPTSSPTEIANLVQFSFPSSTPTVLTETPTLAPTQVPTEIPTRIPTQIPSLTPSVSTKPSFTPTTSQAPSVSQKPSAIPTTSQAPSVSQKPSAAPSISTAPSTSLDPTSVPSSSSVPSSQPSGSQEPSKSFDPTAISPSPDD